MHPATPTARLVIFEGISGSGKTAQVDRADGHLAAKGIRTIRCDSSAPVYDWTREVRESLRSLGSASFLSTTLVHQLTNWAKVEPFLSEPAALLVDRFLLSNLVYTLALAKVFGLHLNRTSARSCILRPFGVDILMHSITFLLTCNPSTAVARARTSSHSSRDLKLQRLAADFYLQERLSYSGVLYTIDANDGFEPVWERIRAILGKELVI